MSLQKCLKNGRPLSHDFYAATMEKNLIFLTCAAE